jgi:hypothetical protein
MSKNVIIDLASNASTTANLSALRAEVDILRRKLHTAQLEIDMLSAERDELVDALRDWARSAPGCPMDQYEVGMHDALPEALERLERREGTKREASIRRIA